MRVKGSVNPEPAVSAAASLSQCRGGHGVFSWPQLRMTLLSLTTIIQPQIIHTLCLSLQLHHQSPVVLFGRCDVSRRGHVSVTSVPQSLPFKCLCCISFSEYSDSYEKVTVNPSYLTINVLVYRTYTYCTCCHLCCFYFFLWCNLNIN